MLIYSQCCKNFLPFFISFKTFVDTMAFIPLLFLQHCSFTPFWESNFKKVSMTKGWINYLRLKVTKHVFHHKFFSKVQNSKTILTRSKYKTVVIKAGKMTSKFMINMRHKCIPSHNKHDTLNQFNWSKIN